MCYQGDGYVMLSRKLLIDCVKVITLVVLGLDVFWYKLELQVGASACEVEYCNNVVVSLAISSRQLIRPALHPIRVTRLQIRRLLLSYFHTRRVRTASETPRFHKNVSHPSSPSSPSIPNVRNDKPGSVDSDGIYTSNFLCFIIVHLFLR